MRILFFCENTIDRPEYHLVTAVARKYAGVRAILGPDSPDAERLRAEGVSVTPLRVRSRLDRRAVQTVRNLLTEGPADVVHCLGSHRQISTALLASRGMSAKQVAYRGTLGHLNRLNPASRLSYLNSRIDRIVCASKAVKDFLLGLRIPESRLCVIYKGHDPAWYEPHERDELAEMGVPIDGLLIGCAARIRPLKGVPVLLQAMALLPADANVHVVLAGDLDDSRVSRLAEAPACRGRVHILGRRDDAPSVMGACDVFAMPSLRREGLPRALIEAMAQGVPAIVSDVGGMPELVHNGEQGIVVPPGDSRALADAILRLADANVRKEMGRRAREQVATQFSLDRTIERTFALYESLSGN